MFIESLSHPRCNDIRILALEITRKHRHIIINTKYQGVLSINTKIILKKIQHRSYYRAMHLVSFIPDPNERVFLIQVLNSAVTYLQNNYDANIVKLWIESIYLKQDPNPNLLINLDANIKDLQSSYMIVVELAFVDKLLSKNDKLV